MSFHIFHISEAYTNADGTLQFIEFHGEANGQHLWDPHTLFVTQGATTRQLPFPGNLPNSNTNDKHVLVATQAFADLTGITPDYIIPANFLFTTGVQTINFPGMDSWVNVTLPTDGLQSRGESINQVAATPENFAGVTVTLAAPQLEDPIDDSFAGNGQLFSLGVAGAFSSFRVDEDPIVYTATLANGDSLPG